MRELNTNNSAEIIKVKINESSATEQLNLNQSSVNNNTFLNNQNEDLQKDIGELQMVNSFNISGEYDMHQISRNQRELVKNLSASTAKLPSSKLD